ncbi:uncharacterized protein LOC121989946 [Zingiber officinale]|uniref:uncharacterized protein LOC121989946 n=1 Tax=Zingiber officinale TaxID=94328 RepID=UPI001C4D1A3B|nr:uncharacterized protein LOC121989946 [Zingiber officinale]
MADGKATLWYSRFISDIDDHDLSMIRSNPRLSDAYELSVPTPQEHPANPPEGFMTVFRDHILGGLRFPIHPFLLSLSQYFGICLSQFAPNFFRAVRPGFKFFSDMPSSHKGWKSRFFFIRPPDPLVELTQWCFDVPSNLPIHQHQPSCNATSEKLQGVSVSLSILLLEGFMYLFGLSPDRADIGAPFEAVMLRAYSSDVKRQSISYLKALSSEIKQGLAASSQSSTSASRSIPSAPPLAPLAPIQEDTSSALPLHVTPMEDLVMVVEDPTPTERAEEERAASPPLAKRLKLQRKRKRVIPATPASPPPPSGRRFVATPHSPETRAATPDREIALGPEVPVMSPQISAPTPGLVITSDQASFPATTSSPGQLPLPLMDQPGSSATQSASLPLAAPISAPRSRRKIRKKYSFTDSWRLPSSTEPGAAEETAEEAPPPVALVEL